MKNNSELNNLLQLAQIAESRIHSYRILYLTALSISTAFGIVLLVLIFNIQDVLLYKMVSISICILSVFSVVFIIIASILVTKASRDASFFYFHIMKYENVFLTPRKRYLTNLNVFRKERHWRSLKDSNFNCFNKNRLDDEEIKEIQIGFKLFRARYMANALMILIFLSIWILLILLLFVPY